MLTSTKSRCRGKTLRRAEKRGDVAKVESEVTMQMATVVMGKKLGNTSRVVRSVTQKRLQDTFWSLSGKNFTRELCTCFKLILTCLVTFPFHSMSCSCHCIFCMTVHVKTTKIRIVQQWKLVYYNSNRRKHLTGYCVRRQKWKNKFFKNRKSKSSYNSHLCKCNCKWRSKEVATRSQCWFRKSAMCVLLLLLTVSVHYSFHITSSHVSKSEYSSPFVHLRITTERIGSNREEYVW